MQKGQLFFSGDQVINFDDLGQFKDYTEDIQNMVSNLRNVIASKENLNIQLLLQIFKADSDDTFHLPSFKQLMKLVLELLKQSPQTLQKSKAYKKTLQNIFAILEESFLSFSFSEDIGPQIVQYNKNKKIKGSFSEIQITYILNFLLRMSDKTSYIENYQLFGKIILSIDLQDIMIVSQDKQDTFLSVYFEVLEQFLRNSKMRKYLEQQIQNSANQKFLYIKFKLFIWEKNMKEAYNRLQSLKKSNIGKFQISNKILAYWKKRLNNLN